ncbi:endonuclease V-like isoform X3 [Scyliorhinus canicula]|uniref:endonuclease V-like isoform X3 n=1 Tax=Scyliorhinus canicula TaxID=7830 RepID=UPI0018F327E2|nr:endonuclease V-like isoform X3 [Scyliorhinus canicula]
MAAALEGESQELLLRQWERRQVELKQQMIDHDTEDWQTNEGFEGLERIGGMDLSYIKGDEVNACASLVVLGYPDLKVIFADGNGILHHREFGVACHLGVLTDLPCIGVAKNLLHVDGLEEKDLLKEKVKDLQKGGNAFSLTGSSGKVLGMALKSCEKSTKPIYVSVGHRISLDTALRLTHSCCKYRVPEPIRQPQTRNPFQSIIIVFEHTDEGICSQRSANTTSVTRRQSEQFRETAPPVANGLFLLCRDSVKSRGFYMNKPTRLSSPR